MFAVVTNLIWDMLDTHRVSAFIKAHCYLIKIDLTAGEGCGTLSSLSCNGHTIKVKLRLGLGMGELAGRNR